MGPVFVTGDTPKPVIVVATKSCDVLWLTGDVTRFLLGNVNLQLVQLSDSRTFAVDYRTDYSHPQLDSDRVVKWATEWLTLCHMTGSGAPVTDSLYLDILYSSATTCHLGTTSTPTITICANGRTQKSSVYSECYPPRPCGLFYKLCIVCFRNNSWLLIRK